VNDKVVLLGFDAVYTSKHNSVSEKQIVSIFRPEMAMLISGGIYTGSEARLRE
jgi:hypothetical protein